MMVFELCLCSALLLLTSVSDVTAKGKWLPATPSLHLLGYKSSGKRSSLFPKALVQVLEFALSHMSPEPHVIS